VAISQSPGLIEGVGAMLFCEGADGAGSFLLFSGCLGEARRSFFSSNSCFFEIVSFCGALFGGLQAFFAIQSQFAP